MFQYSVLVTLWKSLVTFLVTGCGIVVAGEAMDLPSNADTFRATWPMYVLPVLFAALRGLENWRKTSGAGGQPRWRWPWDKIAPVLLLCAVLLGGCAGLGGLGLWRPAVGDHSQATVKFSEKLADGAETEIEYSASGEAASKAGVNYTGETTASGDTTAPWNLSVQGDQSVTSPQAQTVAAGYATLLEQTPATVEALVKQIAAVSAIPDAAGGGIGGLKETIIRMLVERFIGKLPAIQ